MGTETAERLTYSITECAAKMGLSKNSCYLAVKTGEIPSLKIGSRILIPVAALERMLSEAVRHEH